MENNTTQQLPEHISLRIKEVILKEMGCFEGLTNSFLMDHVLEAMDIYADQVAKDFCEWISDHKLDFQPASGRGDWIGLDMKHYSSAELHELYIIDIVHQQANNND